MSDVLMLNKKGASSAPSFRKAPLALLLHLGSPYWLPTLLQLLFLNFLKFLTSLAAYASLLLAAPTVAANATTAAKTIPNTNIIFPFLYFKFNIILFLTIFQCYPIFNLYLVSNTSLILKSIINLFLILTFQS